MELLVLEGDGIGPEITQATLSVLNAASARFGFTLGFQRLDIGLAALERQAPPSRTLC